ncbi:hypothetical protein EB796_024418 [Bugula neritina]|uniref:Fork-head domain-containing protein n=1 Tax=Bugula neritina TaxID=10212 RepID=A0A7J7IUM9_BUGNE|nr:hypothetical protein EB796_024418 [Bugula neritina]
MDYYQTACNVNYYPSLQDVVEVDMYPNDYSPNDMIKQSSVHSPPHHYSSSDMVNNTPINFSTNAAHVQQDCKHSNSFMAMPIKSELNKVDSCTSDTSWYLSQQLVDTCSKNVISSSPPTDAPQSVHDQILSSKLLTLPNNVQITGGSINYVSMESPTQQVYVTTTKAAMTTCQQPSITDTLNYPYRPRSDSNYMLSPNSLPSSTVADNPFPKPPYSYSCLIAMALKNSKHGSLPVAEIYNFMIRHFPYFKTAPDGWKNSVRHNLSLNKCFEKIENPNADGTNSRKGCLWALNPTKMKKMDEEVNKWNKKDPVAIKRAMNYPEMLDALSNGQELHLSNDGIKHSSHGVHQPIMLQQQQPAHHMHPHHQPQSPHPSPALGPIYHPNSMMVYTNGPQSVPIIHAQSQYDISMQQTTAEGYMYANNDVSLDPLLHDISAQSEMWDDLPNDLLDISLPHVYAQNSYIISPKKTSPAMSPAYTNESTTIPNNISKGTLISLGQN